MLLLASHILSKCLELHLLPPLNRWHTQNKTLTSSVLYFSPKPSQRYTLYVAQQRRYWNRRCEEKWHFGGAFCRHGYEDEYLPIRIFQAIWRTNNIFKSNTLPANIVNRLNKWAFDHRIATTASPTRLIANLEQTRFDCFTVAQGVPSLLNVRL